MDKSRSTELGTEDTEPQMLYLKDMEPLKALPADYPCSSGKEGMKSLPREQSWISDSTHG